MLAVLLLLPLRLLLRGGIVLLLLLLLLVGLRLLLTAIVAVLLLLLLIVLLLLPRQCRERIEIGYQLAMQGPRMRLRSRVVEGGSPRLEVLHPSRSMTWSTKVQRGPSLRCQVLSKSRLRLEAGLLRLLIPRLLGIHLRLLLRLLSILRLLLLILPLLLVWLLVLLLLLLL